MFFFLIEKNDSSDSRQNDELIRIGVVHTRFLVTMNFPGGVYAVSHVAPIDVADGTPRS
jgi:hypothetical protein